MFNNQVEIIKVLIAIIKWMIADLPETCRHLFPGLLHNHSKLLYSMPSMHINHTLRAYRHTPTRDKIQRQGLSRVNFTVRN